MIFYLWDLKLDTNWENELKKTKIKSLYLNIYWDNRVSGTSSCNYFITNSVFVSCQSTSHGGGVDLSSSSSSVTFKLYVDHTSFYNCTASNQAGGIYLWSSNSASGCVLNFVCGVKCNAGSGWSDQFDYIRLYSSNSYNYVLQSSFADCINTGSGSFTLDHLYGNILCRSVNLTNNVCSQVSAIYCYIQSSERTSKIEFSSFNNNTAKTSRCLYFVYLLFLFISFSSSSVSLVSNFGLKSSK